MLYANKNYSSIKIKCTYSFSSVLLVCCSLRTSFLCPSSLIFVSLFFSRSVLSAWITSWPRLTIARHPSLSPRLSLFLLFLICQSMPKWLKAAKKMSMKLLTWWNNLMEQSHDSRAYHLTSWAYFCKIWPNIAQSLLSGSWRAPQSSSTGQTSVAHLVNKLSSLPHRLQPRIELISNLAAEWP